MMKNDVTKIESELYKILVAGGYQPPDAHKPKNEVDIIALDGEVEELEKLEKILANVDSKDTLTGTYCFWIESYTASLIIQRKNNVITLSIGGIPGGFYFAIGLNAGFRFLYWNEEAMQYTYQIHCSQLPKEYGRLDIKLFWENVSVEKYLDSTQDPLSLDIPKDDKASNTERIDKKDSLEQFSPARLSVEIEEKPNDKQAPVISIKVPSFKLKDSSLAAKSGDKKFTHNFSVFGLPQLDRLGVLIICDKSLWLCAALDDSSLKTALEIRDKDAIYPFVSRDSGWEYDFHVTYLRLAMELLGIECPKNLDSNMFLGYAKGVIYDRSVFSQYELLLNQKIYAYLELHPVIPSKSDLTKVLEGAANNDLITFARCFPKEKPKDVSVQLTLLYYLLYHWHECGNIDEKKRFFQNIGWLSSYFREYAE